ncbi:hypothetical protein DH2020_035398 [Rehmannia glutinosa]|uniref:Coenzyme Q-binding protein COQ10 START domain-containing protein n=1 Tax=Rehmannia glutinosa TaxID=99300 RepID=A0ABR0V6U7_REHGL
MPPIKPTSKAVARLNFCRDLFRQQITNNSNCSQIRCLSHIAGTNAFSSSDKIVGGRYNNYSFSNFGNSSNSSKDVFQKRGFLGCVNGGEDMLSKVYEERRVLGYKISEFGVTIGFRNFTYTDNWKCGPLIFTEQLFNVVAAVDMYQEFLPWCQRSEIIRRNPDGTFDAELEIGFKFLVESYVSHVELSKPKSIKTTASQSSIFDHLINVWEFNPGPVPGTCNLYFLVDFKFKSPLYGQLLSLYSESDLCRLGLQPTGHNSSSPILLEIQTKGWTKLNVQRPWPMDTDNMRRALEYSE